MIINAWSHVLSGPIMFRLILFVSLLLSPFHAYAVLMGQVY